MFLSQNLKRRYIQDLSNSGKNFTTSYTLVSYYIEFL